MNRKAILISRLIVAVEEYVVKFHKPVPMRVLSARFAKAMDTEGGFPETLRELEADGTIEVQLSESGARSVQLIRLTAQAKG